MAPTAPPHPRQRWPFLRHLPSGRQRKWLLLQDGRGRHVTTLHVFDGVVNGFPFRRHSGRATAILRNDCGRRRRRLGNIFRLDSSGNSELGASIPRRRRIPPPLIQAPTACSSARRTAAARQEVSGGIFQLFFDTVALLYGFQGPDGGYSAAGVTDRGALYGTTRLGGDHERGTVFQFDYELATIHNFDDGEVVSASLRATAGLYGTTVSGGANGRGTIFKIGGGYSSRRFTASMGSTGGGHRGSDPGGGRRDIWRHLRGPFGGWRDLPAEHAQIAVERGFAELRRRRGRRRPDRSRRRVRARRDGDHRRVARDQRHRRRSRRFSISSCRRFLRDLRRHGDRAGGRGERDAPSRLHRQRALGPTITRLHSHGRSHQHVGHHQRNRLYRASPR